jgi:twitching motility two-component system response regulator PilH
MNGEPVTILTGRDDPNDLEVLTSRLIAEKFKVLPVADRTAIVTLARSEVPNLIVLDLKSCFDVCRSLKRNFVTEPIPIIALLFPAEEVDRVAALQLGADDCLAKPFNFRELNLRIRCSLARARDKMGKARYKQAKYYSALTRVSASSSPTGPRSIQFRESNFPVSRTETRRSRAPKGKA